MGLHGASWASWRFLMRFYRVLRGPVLGEIIPLGICLEFISLLPRVMDQHSPPHLTLHSPPPII